MLFDVSGPILLSTKSGYTVFPPSPRLFLLCKYILIFMWCTIFIFFIPANMIDIYRSCFSADGQPGKGIIVGFAHELLTYVYIMQVFKYLIVSQVHFGVYFMFCFLLFFFLFRREELVVYWLIQDMYYCVVEPSPG